MKCVICKNGELKPGQTTVPFERNGAVVIIRDVPALICDNCGEPTFAEDVSGQLLEMVEKDLKAGIDVVIRHFSAQTAAA